MGNVHNRGSWLVYINGVEVPATSARVSSGVWQVPQANVSFPADRILQRIGVNDRVRLTIFALDPYRHLVEGGDPQFRLAFDGEIVAYGYQTSNAGRTISFTAVDMIESLMRLFPFFITSLSSLVRGKTSTDQSKLTGAGNPFAITHSLFTQGVSGDGHIQRPYDFVQNILDYLLGDVLDYDEKSAIVQQWFSPWNHRTKFSDRFVPSAYIEKIEEGKDTPVFPLLKAAQRSKAVEALADMGDSLGNGGSMWQLIQAVYQHVYYELATLSTPPVLRINSETREVVGRQADSSGTEDVVATYMTKPQLLFGVPPSFNVLWPSMIEQFSYDENYATQPTRTYVGNPHLFNYLNKPGTDAAFESKMLRELTVGYPAIANRRLRDKDRGDKINQHNYITHEEQFKGPVYNQISTPTWFLYLQQRKEEPKEGSETEPISPSLQQLYARYEHHRIRASRRNGGVTCSYNPYALPGFPGMVIDTEHSGNHVFGYFTQVTHSFMQTSMSTSIGFSHAQTISEYFDTLIDRMVRDDEESIDPETFVRGAPEQPIWELRDRFQTLKGAAEYYAKMFWNAEYEQMEEGPVFDVLSVFGIHDGDISLRDIDLNADLKLARASDTTPTGTRLKMASTSNPITGEPPDFRVRSSWRRLLEDPKAAYAYASRPIATLDQWIDAQKNYGGREGKRLPANKDEGKGAPYYVRILFGDPGPPYPPSKSDLDGNPCDTVEVDSTRDWTSRLRAYRKRVYTARHPYRA